MQTKQSLYYPKVATNGCVNVLRVDFTEDGVQTNHRHILTPGADLTNEAPEVAAYALEQWTPEVRAAWQASLPPPPTPEQIAQQTAAALESAVDEFMDSKARAKGFRDRLAFALRAGIPGSSWHAQALVFGAWMDSVNDYCWQVKLDCLAGKRTVPTLDGLLAELPVLEV